MGIHVGRVGEIPQGPDPLSQAVEQCEAEGAVKADPALDPERSPGLERDEGQEVERLDRIENQGQP